MTTFLAKNGVENSLPKSERPKKRPVSKDGHDLETWDDEDIRKLLAVCKNAVEILIVLVGSETGARRGEVAHLERDNILDGIIVVRGEKPKYDFSTKKGRGRNVAVPRWLTDKLKEYIRMLPAGQALLFPSEEMNRLCRDADVEVPRTAGECE